MLTLGELTQQPERLVELEGCDVLVATEDETVIQKARQEPEATALFEHETMKMMMAERAERIEQLRQLLGPKSAVIPIRKRPESFWDHVTLGRASTADLVVDDPAISNVHAHFQLDSAGRLAGLQDVGSSNGTFINRERLQPHTLERLRTGDVVRFGQTIFYYVGRAMFRTLVTGEE
jgi:hypothetical protein